MGAVRLGRRNVSPIPQKALTSAGAGLLFTLRSSPCGPQTWNFRISSPNPHTHVQLEPPLRVVPAHRQEPSQTRFTPRRPLRDLRRVWGSSGCFWGTPLGEDVLLLLDTSLFPLLVPNLFTRHALSIMLMPGLVPALGTRRRDVSVLPAQGFRLEGDWLQREGTWSSSSLEACVVGTVGRLLRDGEPRARAAGAAEQWPWPQRGAAGWRGGDRMAKEAFRDGLPLQGCAKSLLLYSYEGRRLRLKCSKIDPWLGGRMDRRCLRANAGGASFMVKLGCLKCGNWL